MTSPDKQGRDRTSDDGRHDGLRDDADRQPVHSAVAYVVIALLITAAFLGAYTYALSARRPPAPAPTTVSTPTP